MRKAVGTALFAIAAIFIVASASMAPTAATFTDKVTSSGNTFTAATMAPPTLTALKNAANPANVDLSWTDPDTFVTAFTLYRHTTNTCTDAGTSIYTGSSPHTDAPGPPPGPYYYQVVASVGPWTSASNCASITTTSPTNTLYPNTGNQLVGAPGTGSELLGCDSVNLLTLVCLTPNPVNSYTFASTANYWVYANAGWTVQLNLTVQALLSLSLSSQNLNVALWYVAAGNSCGSPVAGQTMATGSASILGLIILLSSTTKNVAIPMTASTPFTAPTAPSTICMSVTGNPSLLSAGVFLKAIINNHNTTTATVGDSFVQGPFAP